MQEILYSIFLLTCKQTYANKWNAKWIRHRVISVNVSHPSSDFLISSCTNEVHLRVFYMERGREAGAAFVRLRKVSSLISRCRVPSAGRR